MEEKEGKRVLEQAFPCLHALLNSASETSEIKATARQYDRFFCVMESVMSHGLKNERKGFFNSNPIDMWDVIQELPSVYEESRESVNFCERYPNIETDIARGRIWLRWCFNHQILRKVLKALVLNPSVTSRFYNPTAILANRDQSQMLLGVLAPLENLTGESPIDGVPF
eukprot:CAMPEP_0201494422 /NCGR_PEP_ID=MMETSP0151_2-20130828/47315_1 /ASSEMBLY_ACC=CAM_ASM_000257 /TAXON_ID=200890 /ORGANISM="Paramoeba atlantica, Strain 621/1 / CCAP 1560/9" /LENGTH=168 /DNA_ID=CAMNT_0047882655 /DNA_START=1 /DNA_END=504 /DNA_ORIENTATION=+